ncbi:MAG: hypothetical protein II525_07440 [Bacteroidales bacterium]|nr:hypothetical protein [Bacteroidales bacterium]
MKKQFLLPVLATMCIAGAMFLTACEKEHQSIKEGISGIVVERYGNWMPVIDPNSNNHGERPIITGIYVYEYTRISDFDSTTRHNCYSHFPIDKMPKPLVATAVSNADGFYEIPLKPGKYSVFLLENGKMYANEMDGSGGYLPVTVCADSVSRVVLVLDHAVY